MLFVALRHSRNCLRVPGTFRQYRMHLTSPTVILILLLRIAACGSRRKLSKNLWSTKHLYKTSAVPECRLRVRTVRPTATRDGRFFIAVPFRMWVVGSPPQRGETYSCAFRIRSCRFQSEHGGVAGNRSVRIGVGLAKSPEHQMSMGTSGIHPDDCKTNFLRSLPVA